MLSNTKGYSRFSRALGYHREDLSALGQVCPTWRSTGKCKSYDKEQEIRRTLAAAKEAELLKKATSLYNAQMDLMADLGSVEGDAELLDSMTAQGGFSTDPSKKDEMVQKLIAELKQEPAYLNWSLDADVAERMVELRVKPCRFSHRGELTASLKRSRSAQDREEGRLAQQQQREQQEVLRSSNAEAAGRTKVEAAAPAHALSSSHSLPPMPTSQPRGSAAQQARAHAQAQRWEEERHRMFQSLTPLQRCVVCLLWQRQYTVEQGVVCDVRLLLEKRLTEQFERTGRIVVEGAVVAERRGTGNHKSNAEDNDEDGGGDDPLDRYLSSADFEQLVEQESKRKVTRVTFRPEFGTVDLSALSPLVAYVSSTPGCGVFLARTLIYFTGEALAPRQSAAPSQAAHNRSSNSERSGSSATDQRVEVVVEAEDDRPAPTSFHRLLFPTHEPVTEKEVDLGGTARADEVVEAMEWVLQVYQREAQLRSACNGSLGGAATFSTISDPQEQQHVSALFARQRVRLHGFTLTHCKITSADALIGALRKRNLEQFLYALDLSDNRLWSLRFLLVLRAHFAQRLLRLSLRGNPITRKPEYQEQVRRSLPQLTSLDGEPIRRPPLRLPKPLPSSCTRWINDDDDHENDAGNNPRQQQRRKRTEKEEEEKEKERERRETQTTVLDCVARLLYIFETRRIPHTARELRAFHEAANGPITKEEEEWNEDNFPHRYLHPAATFSVALAPELSFFDAASMRDARSVELDTMYTGMRLSAVDVRDARVFDVAMKNSSRNLLAGRPALQRFGKGADSCYLAYQFTLYPERMAVLHHVSDAVVSVACVTDSDIKAVAAATATKATGSMSEKKGCSSSNNNNINISTTKKRSRVEAATSAQQRHKHFGTLARDPAPTQHIVTLHGTMTWQLPSMRAGECMRAAYTRVMILTRKVLPAQNREWERLRSPPYVLMNDTLFLYPAASLPQASIAVAPSAIFRANTPARLSRLVVEFGLEACRDGVALVRDVMERCTSAAAEYAALQALVLGVVGPRGVVAHTNTEIDHHESGTSQVTTAATGTLAAEDAAAVLLARTAAAQLRPVLEAFVSAATTSSCASTASNHTSAPLAPASHTYTVFSVLEGATSTAAADTEEENRVELCEARKSAQSSSHEQHPRSSKKKAKKEGEVPKKDGGDDGDGSGVTVYDESLAQSKDRIQQWASGLHVVTRSLVHDVTAITNACYTFL